jgi:transcriptional regulator with XRE-family HTH domain
MDLRAWRKSQGLSLAEMAARLNVQHYTVSRWETGQSEIPLHAAAEIIEITQGAVGISDLAALTQRSQKRAAWNARVDGAVRT